VALPLLTKRFHIMLTSADISICAMLQFPAMNFQVVFSWPVWAGVD
jgi:hypothetical protein